MMKHFFVHEEDIHLPVHGGGDVLLLSVGSPTEQE